MDQVLTLAARHAVDQVELRSLGGTMELPSYFTEHFKTPRQLGQYLRRSPIKISAVGTSFRLIGNTASDREALLHFVPWAEEIGVSHLRVFDGGNTADSTEITQGIETLNWWRKLRAHHRWKVDLVVETHDAFTTTDSILHLTAKAPDVAILWDAHHTWKKGGENPLATWSALKSHVVHIHVKDSVSRPSGKNPFTYVLPGEGEFPAAPLFAVLKNEFSGVVSLEWEKAWHPSLASLDEALTRAGQSQWW